jgi:lipopolysaccharide export system protein LptA
MKIIFTYLLSIFISTSAFAIDLNQVIKPEEGEPIIIKANNLIIKNNKNLAIFKTNVRVKQGQMFMLADEVRLYSDYNEKTQKSSFKQLEAKGNIDFKSLDSSVKSDYASYNVKTGILDLKGNVKLADTQSSLEGKVFTYNAKSGKSVIRNSIPEDSIKYGSKAAENSRVRAVFVPGEGVKNVTMPTNALDGYKQQKQKQKQ